MTQVRNTNGNMEYIFIEWAQKMGVDTTIPLVKSATYQARLAVKEYVENIIGPDDLSPGAQKLRAKLRKM